MGQPGADQGCTQRWQQTGLASPGSTASQGESRRPQAGRHQHQQSALLHQHRGQSSQGCRPHLGPTAAVLRIQPDIQPPERPGHRSGQRHLEHVIGAQIQQRRCQSGQQTGQQGQALTLQPPPPACDRQQEQAMPEAEAPCRLGGIITTEGHDAAVHQRGQGRNLGGEVQQGFPSLPTAAREQAQGTAMVEGAVEVVRLIPGGYSPLMQPPESIHQRGQQPDQAHPKPQPPTLTAGISSHAISRRRRSSCSRLRRCLASRSISRPSWR